MRRHLHRRRTRCAAQNHLLAARPIRRPVLVEARRRAVVGGLVVGQVLVRVAQPRLELVVVVGPPPRSPDRPVGTVELCAARARAVAVLARRVVVAVGALEFEDTREEGFEGSGTRRDDAELELEAGGEPCQCMFSQYCVRGNGRLTIPRTGCSG
jgi:hypothetical protein